MAKREKQKSRNTDKNWGDYAIGEGGIADFLGRCKPGIKRVWGGNKAAGEKEDTNCLGRINPGFDSAGIAGP